MQTSEKDGQQIFRMVTDFLELDEQTFQRMLPDLMVWHSITRKALPALDEAGVKPDGFIWIDDGNPGNCEGVTLRIKAE
jgi:hypothetical protein